ncbi:hypothetical protein [Endozoicomonas sp. YOMI1]|uniref:hypothetical protein n=1 Tax=Endozoicomonas sp. YOMI1 TaxID=2828739 RepID=UPI0021479433|nr:hypothetical protein [Endozoicomonas sp. YOMI1]
MVYAHTTLFAEAFCSGVLRLYGEVLLLRDIFKGSGLMVNPDKGFDGRTVKSAITVLSAAVIIAASSTIAHAKKTEASDKDNDNSMPLYAVLADGESGGKYKQKRRVNSNPQNLSVSRDFKFYNQVASLDLTDPVQAETLLKFMDIRLAEKELNEEVVLVSDNDSETKAPEMTVPIAPDKQAIVNAEQAEQQRALKPEVANETAVVRQMPASTTITKDSKDQEPAKITKPEKLDRKREPQGPRLGSLQKENDKVGEEKSELGKDKERARIARVRESRQSREQAKQKAEEPRLVEERRKAEGKAKAGAAKVEKAERGRVEAFEALAEQKKRKEEGRERFRPKREKEHLLAEKKKEETARLAKQETEKAEPPKPATINILPSRPVAYQIAAEQDPGIINFDQAITRRFRVAGSYLDKGEHGNNIVKDHRGREFMNVMAFWDVLVEHRENGENYYYGSIQFPLGSRHPAIIKSTVPGDEIMLGCKAGEIMVFKGFETEGIDYTHGLVDAYLAHSMVMPDGTIAFQEVVRQPSFSLVNVETGCMPRDLFSRSHVDPERMGHDKTLHALPVRE